MTSYKIIHLKFYSFENLFWGKIKDHVVLRISNNYGGENDIGPIHVSK
jgi:hypothetical protein